MPLSLDVNVFSSSFSLVYFRFLIILALYCVKTKASTLGAIKRSTWSSLRWVCLQSRKRRKEKARTPDREVNLEWRAPRLLFVRLLSLFDGNPISLGRMIRVRGHHQTSAERSLSSSWSSTKAIDLSLEPRCRSRWHLHRSMCSGVQPHGAQRRKLPLVENYEEKQEDERLIQFNLTLLIANIIISRELITGRDAVVEDIFPFACRNTSGRTFSRFFGSPVLVVVFPHLHRYRTSARQE